MSSLQIPHREKHTNGVTAPTTKAVILVRLKEGREPR